MTSERQKILKSIISTASDIKNLSSDCDQEQLPTISTSSSLHIPPIKTSPIQAVLKERSLSSQVIRLIVSAYTEHAQQLDSSASNHHQQAVNQILSTSPSSEIFDQLASTFQSCYFNKLDELQTTLIRKIDSRIAQFQADASSSSSESESPGGAGHSKTAVTILEYAYSQSQNISQAEKNRLAELTGLQPRQVTIWVSTKEDREGDKGKWVVGQRGIRGQSEWICIGVGSIEETNQGKFESK